METTNSDDNEFTLYDMSGFRLYVVLRTDAVLISAKFRNYYTPIATGTFAEMSALHKLMNAAHGNN